MEQVLVGEETVVLEGYGERFRIVSNGTPAGTYVFMNGKRLEGVQRLSFDVNVDNIISTIKLEMVPGTAEFDLICPVDRIEDQTSVSTWDGLREFEEVKSRWKSPEYQDSYTAGDPLDTERVYDTLKEVTAEAQEEERKRLLVLEKALILQLAEVSQNLLKMEKQDKSKEKN